MSAEHVFRDFLLQSADSRLPEYRRLKSAVIEVWAANGHPAVIETADPRHGDDTRTFFVFHNDLLGPNFFVTQYPPRASTLHCPDHLLPTPPVADIDPYQAAYACEPGRVDYGVIGSLDVLRPTRASTLGAV